jgi:hypothetical protein
MRRKSLCRSTPTTEESSLRHEQSNVQAKISIKKSGLWGGICKEGAGVSEQVLDASGGRNLAADEFEPERRRSENLQLRGQS